MTTLREMLQQPAPAPAAWADAQHFARERFGTVVADAIRWRVDSDGEVVGLLADGTDTLRLRYEMAEPGSEMLWVSVTCPFDPECSYGVDLVSDTAGLLRVLDGGVADDDPRCDLGEEDEHDVRRQTGVVEDVVAAAAGWPPARSWPF